MVDLGTDTPNLAGSGCRHPPLRISGEQTALREWCPLLGTLRVLDGCPSTAGTWVPGCWGTPRCFPSHIPIITDLIAGPVRFLWSSFFSAGGTEPPALPAPSRQPGRSQVQALREPLVQQPQRRLTGGLPVQVTTWTCTPFTGSSTLSISSVFSKRRDQPGGAAGTSTALNVPSGWMRLRNLKDRGPTPGPGIKSCPRRPQLRGWCSLSLSARCRSAPPAAAGAGFTQAQEA